MRVVSVNSLDKRRGGKKGTLEGFADLRADDELLKVHRLALELFPSPLTSLYNTTKDAIARGALEKKREALNESAKVPLKLWDNPP